MRMGELKSPAEIVSLMRNRKEIVKLKCQGYFSPWNKSLPVSLSFYDSN